MHQSICTFSGQMSHMGPSFFSRSNVPHGPLFRRNLSHVWHRGNFLCRAGSGRQDRPDGVHISPDDQVHVSQVWHQRGD